MIAGLEDHDERQSGRLEEAAQTPPVRRPDVVAVRGGAPLALGPALAVAWRFPIEWRPQWPGAPLPLERRRVPLLHRGHAELGGASRLDPLPGFTHPPH